MHGLCLNAYMHVYMLCNVCICDVYVYLDTCVCGYACTYV